MVFEVAGGHGSCMERTAMMRTVQWQQFERPELISLEKKGLADSVGGC